MVVLNTPEEKLNNGNGIDGVVPEITEHADVVDGAVEEDDGGGKVDAEEFAGRDAVSDDALDDGLAAQVADDDGMSGILGRGDVFHDGAVVLALLAERADDEERHFGEAFGRRLAVGGDLLELVAERGDGGAGDGIQDVVFILEIIIKDAARDIEALRDVLRGERFPAALAEQGCLME